MKRLFSLLMLTAFVSILTVQCKATQKANTRLEKDVTVSTPENQEETVHAEDAEVVSEPANNEEQDFEETEIEAEIETEVEIEIETQEVEITAKESAVSVPAGLHYRVQVAATLAPPKHYRETFAGLHAAMPQLKMEVTHDSDGYYRYVTLPYATYAEADAVREKIKALGYDCFVGTYSGNQRVSISVK
jgi:cytoskeletal protein RodZ